MMMLETLKNPHANFRLLAPPITPPKLDYCRLLRAGDPEGGKLSLFAR
jgi:hypothetical protein